jgi:hypothetical protein
LEKTTQLKRKLMRRCILRGARQRLWQACGGVWGRWFTNGHAWLARSKHHRMSLTVFPASHEPQHKRYA